MVGGGFPVATMSNLNPSYVELLWVELGLGFDNILKTRMDDKRSFEHTYLSQPVVLEIKYQSLFLLPYIYIIKIRMDDKRSFEHTYMCQPVVLEVKCQSLILAYIYIL